MKIIWLHIIHVQLKILCLLKNSWLKKSFLQKLYQNCFKYNNSLKIVFLIWNWKLNHRRIISFQFWNNRIINHAPLSSEHRNSDTKVFHTQLKSVICNYVSLFQLLVVNNSFANANCVCWNTYMLKSFESFYLRASLLLITANY